MIDQTTFVNAICDGCGKSYENEYGEPVWLSSINDLESEIEADGWFIDTDGDPMYWCPDCRVAHEGKENDNGVQDSEGLALGASSDCSLPEVSPER